jgi:hypothetical protein
MRQENAEIGDCPEWRSPLLRQGIDDDEDLWDNERDLVEEPSGD